VPKLDAEQVQKFLEEVWPGSTSAYEIEHIGNRTARLRMQYTPERLRPGGIISGPALMTLADCAVWVALLGDIGPEAMTVTVSLSINFFRPGRKADVIAETRLHRVGRRLATGDVLMYSEGDPDPIAQATVTYAIPSSNS
jgi:uncharacterized protein (TIGR00369 family)